MKISQEINTFNSLANSDKVPRKHKLKWLGRKISNKKLRDKIKDWKFQKEKGSCSHCFCVNCGCDVIYYVDHKETYPDEWIEQFCLRCHSRVAVKDNTPWVCELDLI